MACSLEKVDQVDDWAALGLTEAVLLLVGSPVPSGDPGTFTFLWELPSHKDKLCAVTGGWQRRLCRKSHRQKRGRKGAKKTDQRDIEAGYRRLRRRLGP